MTLQGHPGEEHDPTPPARTRWSGDAGEEDDILLPPYIPGGHPAGPPREGKATTGPSAGHAAPAPAPGSPPADEAGFAFPWEGEGGEDQPEPWAEGAAAEAPHGQAEVDAAPDAGAGPEPWAPEPWAMEAPAAPAAASSISDDEDAFPFEAFDIEGGPDEGLADAAEEVESRGAASAGGGPDELVRRVEDLAAVLRAEGKAGVERALKSRDRLTSLLAGVLAGYLAGQED